MFHVKCRGGTPAASAEVLAQSSLSGGERGLLIPAPNLGEKKRFSLGSDDCSLHWMPWENSTHKHHHHHGKICSRKIKVVLIGRLQVGSRDSSREAALRIWRPFSISFNLVLAGPPLDYWLHQDPSPACLSLLSYPWSSSPEKWSHYTPGKISYHIQVEN